MAKISKEDLFREIGEIDEKYVEEAQRVKKPCQKTSRITKALAAAASLMLCIGVGYGALQLMDADTESSSDSAADMAGQLQAENFGEELAVEEAAEEAPSAAEASANAIEQAASEEKEMELSDNPAAENVTEEAAQQELAAVTEASQEMDMADRTENSPAEEAEPESLGQQISAGSAKSLTWEEASADAAYGRYVDIQVPEGYTYTSGTRTDVGLHVIWNKGMEEISISCRQADESVSDWLVDAENPEEYDLSLYPIPWCDSVPEELYSKVMYATFVPEQITQEIVAARTYQVEEAGDVSGYRTCIAVLYRDNVWVEITGKGPSPEEIYALINLEN